MNFWNWLTRRRDDHGWPDYLINGRIRTSTVGLIVAFFVIAWLHNTYQPPPPAPVGAGDGRSCRRGSCPTPSTPGCRAPTSRSGPDDDDDADHDDDDHDHRDQPDRDHVDVTDDVRRRPGQPTTVVDPDGPGPLPPQTLTPSTDVGARLRPPFRRRTRRRTAPTTPAPPR